MGQLYGWGMLKAIDKNTLALVGSVRVLSGTPQGCHTATFYPLLYPVQQSPGYLVILNNFKKTKGADTGIMVVVKAVVNGR